MEPRLPPAPAPMYQGVTIPKPLRLLYLHRRGLLGSLCRAAWEEVVEWVAKAAGEDVRPGMVEVDGDLQVPKRFPASAVGA